MTFGHILHRVQCASQENHCAEKGSDGPRRRGPPLGESGHGLIGYVSHVGKRKSLCISYGGLFLEMDGGLPSTRQDSYLSGGRFLQ